MEVNLNRLRFIRSVKGITQHQLMKETGIYFSTLSRFERGWLKPSDKRKSKLAEALGVTVEWLFPKRPKIKDESK